MNIDKNKPNARELALINQYSDRQLSADEVFVASIVLCDNDVDKDYEQLTCGSLMKLAKLYEGMRGVVDIYSDYAPRIFSCKLESVPGKVNTLREPYYTLVGKFYIPIVSETADLRAKIVDGSISKVSIACSTDPAVCSICHKPLSECEHVKGHFYNSELCYGLLYNPRDVYEFAFVAGGVVQMLDKFTKDDLEDRMVVVTREGTHWLVIGDRLVAEDHYIELNECVDFGDVIIHGYRQDLLYDSTYPCDRKYDIVKVYSKLTCLSQLPYYRTELDLLWERSSPIRLSLADLKELFGCDVRIVDSDLHTALKEAVK